MADREDPQLARAERTFRDSGAHILLAGGLLAVLGGLVYLLGTGTAAWVRALGAMLSWVAVAPTVLGLVLLGIALVTGHASRERPFA